MCIYILYYKYTDINIMFMNVCYFGLQKSHLLDKVISSLFYYLLERLKS
jgi:hypothetical protein